MIPPASANADMEGFPVPQPPDQDPSGWDDAKLRYYGLPPKPDQWRQPRLYEAWVRTFGHELLFTHHIPATPKVIVRTSRSGAVVVRIDVAQPAVMSRTSRFVSSPNWSGATVDATSGRMFKQVYGDWIVTNVTQPPDEEDGIFRCASWIGIDGQRHYLNATLPQVGTLETLTVDPSNPPETVLQAWTQWWAPNDPNAKPVFIKDFPLNFGDHISAVITVTGRHHVVCNLVNQSTNPPTIVSVRMRAPRIRNPDPSGPLLAERYRVTGATAEWVLERPAVIGEPGQLEKLCDYGTTTFAACLAVETEVDGSKPIARTLRTARFVRMFGRRHDPERTVYLSMPERKGEDGFCVRFGDVWS